MMNEVGKMGAFGAFIVLGSFTLNWMFNALDIDDTDLGMWGVAIGFPMMGLAVVILIVMQIAG